MIAALRRNASGFAKSVRERGALATLRIAASTMWCTLLDVLDERTYRTNTAGNVPLESLEIRSENKAHAAECCSPSPFRLIQKALRAVQAFRGGGFSGSTLVDFGCGRGRVLLVASEFGFKKLIGVEFSPDICREAERNVAAYVAREKAPVDFEIANADAARFEIPPDADVFYVFAFDGHMTDRIARNIARSREQFPRPIWTIYIKATHGDVFTKRGFRAVHGLHWCGFPTTIYAL
jgi:SAM-dependent methyltransferase